VMVSHKFWFKVQTVPFYRYPYGQKFKQRLLALGYDQYPVLQDRQLNLFKAVQVAHSSEHVHVRDESSYSVTLLHSQSLSTMLAFSLQSGQSAPTANDVHSRHNGFSHTLQSKSSRHPSQPLIWLDPQFGQD